MFGVGALLLLLVSNPTTWLDNTLYDAHMRHWPLPASENVIIVAIDQKSLSELGRWPWPRSLHARLLDQLTQEGVRGVGMDILMVDPDRENPKNDKLLAAAAQREGHVVMSVFAEPGEHGGTMVELIPTAVVASGAASLGHTEVVRDQDRVARGTYLKAGLGTPYWPALALAMIQSEGDASPLNALPGVRNPTPDAGSPYLWTRDLYVMPRFAGPPGSFGTLSYVDVLNGQVAASDLRGRWVLVGVTAGGLGTRFDTPTTTEERMSGVEFQANLLASLEANAVVTPLAFGQQFILGGLVIAFPCAAYGLPGLRRRLVVTTVTLALILIGAVWLLRTFGAWWPPSPCVIVVLGGYLLLATCERLSVAYASSGRL